MRNIKQLIAMGAVLSAALAAFGQTLPAEIADELPPKNIDRTLDSTISVDAEKQSLNEFIAELRKQTDTNITLNWNALSQAGLTRDTPVTLRLTDVPYETVVQTLMEILPAQKSRANYLVGDNTLTITTNAELGKGATPRLYSLDRVIGLSLSGAAADVAAHDKLIEEVLRAELVRAGEPMDAGGPGGQANGVHVIAIRGGTLAASVSDRGHFILVRATTMLSMPVKPGQYAPGTAVTASAKRAMEALGKVANGKVTDATYVMIAKEPEKYRAALNFALLPGTMDDLAKDTPAVDGTVSDGGVVLIGPKNELASRTLFAAYDIREAIKRQMAGSTPPLAPAAGERAVIEGVKKKISPVDGWGGIADLGKRPSVLIGYEGMLMVFATADEQRAVTMALAEMGR